MSLAAAINILQQMQTELQLTAELATAAAESVERLNEAEAASGETTSTMARAAGAGASTMGSSSGPSSGGSGITAAGLAAALNTTRLRVG